MNLGSLKVAGVSGYSWGVVAYTSPLSAYTFLFDSATVYPSSYYTRWNGLAVQNKPNKNNLRISYISNSWREYCYCGWCFMGRR